jgi:hypothetical protein
MTGIKILEQIKIEYKNIVTGDLFPVYIDIFDSSLARKWLDSLNHLLKQNYFLEKNFCFMGWPDYHRDGKYILDQINNTIGFINSSKIGYHIDDYFSLENTITDEPVKGKPERGRNLIHQRTNDLHRYFEDLQGVSGKMSQYYELADAETRWHIRQINLLCHEFESWALSYRKQVQAPEWICPSQLMCWLNAPRFVLDEEDYESFGIETISRPTGAVYVGVNKAVGKHHWEVYHDEGRDSRIDELTTTTLKSQTEAAGDFDIEWGRSAEKIATRQREIEEFREWLIKNGFDPDDKRLTLGHPQIGQVNFEKSFGFDDPQIIWKTLSKYLDVFSIVTSDAKAVYEYHWSDIDFAQKQIDIIGK